MVNTFVMWPIKFDQFLLINKTENDKTNKTENDFDFSSIICSSESINLIFKK